MIATRRLDDVAGGGRIHGAVGHDRLPGIDAPAADQSRAIDTVTR